MEGNASMSSLLISLLFLLIFLWPIGHILTRTGHSKWWALLSLVPILNIIAFWYFAYKDWDA